MQWSGLPAAVPRGGTFLSATVRGRVHTAVSADGLMTAFLTIFSACSAWMQNCGKYRLTPLLSGPTSTVPVPGKTVPPAEIGHSRGGASTKIHAAVDAYGYPVYMMISEGQRNDINFAVPVLEHVNIENSSVLADRGYDSNELIDYIYGRSGDPTIPSRKGAKYQRRCDWWLYKERHLVEKYFLKLKAFRRIATRYDKLPFTFLGFICLASILIWLK